jgi:hypothetical protein
VTPTLLLQNSLSHWSATGPRSKTQNHGIRNTQRKTTRAQSPEPNRSDRKLKPVRPVSSDLAPHALGETGQAGLVNRSGWFPQT